MHFKQNTLIIDHLLLSGVSCDLLFISDQHKHVLLHLGLLIILKLDTVLINH